MNLKQLRSERKLTQKQVADEIGCSVVVYSRYETGDRMPSVDMLIRLADCFHVTMDELVGRQANAVSYILSAEEVDFLSAYRSTDLRAREDALQLLRGHGTP